VKSHYFLHPWSSFIQIWPLRLQDQETGPDSGERRGRLAVWELVSQEGPTPSGRYLGQVPLQDLLCPFQVLSSLPLHTFPPGGRRVTCGERVAPALVPYSSQSIIMCLSSCLSSPFYNYKN
jgi:hypothetical protein